MQASLFLALTAGIVPVLSTGATLPAGEVVVVKAGTIYVVDRDRVVEGGATMLVRDGKVVAVDKTIDAPPNARVVDYGAEAVIVPGFVAADSQFGLQRPADRTADADVSARDNFDPFASYATSLAGGVTSAYVPPARGRLIAGQGGVFKLAGEPGPARILSASAAIHGSISSDARSTPGYWEPPVPATVDVGLGVELAQLPRTTMGAIVALRELLELAAGGEGSNLYGPYVGPALAELLKEKRPWRMTAQTEPEIRALLAFFGERGLPLVLDGALEAGAMAKEIHAAGVPVIVEVPYRPGSAPQDRGKGEDDLWPRFDTASLLAAEGVPFAICVRSGVSSLRLAARLASRGGLDPALALRAITLAPAEILGVADRVGSLAPGRDADFVVLTGAPLAATSAVVATWVDGEIAWKAHESEATVLSVDELHLGDGHVLSPGELLLLDGRIAEIGRVVGHPPGATVVHGQAAMPGMIDAKGYLGLEGSTRVPAPRFKYAAMVESGDRTDRRVANAGVTTVVLTPRGTSSSGAPAMAYKPASTDLERMVVADPAALYVKWAEENRLESGVKVRELLAKGVEYRQKWIDYEKELAAWTPPPPEAPKAEEETKKEEGAEEKKEESAEEPKEEAKEEAEVVETGPKPVTGSWEGTVDDPAESGAKIALRLRLNDDGSGKLEGTLRCDAVSGELVLLEGALKTATTEEAEAAPEKKKAVPEEPKAVPEEPKAVPEEPKAESEEAKDPSEPKAEEPAAEKAQDEPKEPPTEGAEKPAEEKQEEGKAEEKPEEKEKKRSKKDDEDAPPVRSVTLTGLGTRGTVTVDGTVQEPPKPKKKKKDEKEEEKPEPRKLVGSVKVGASEIAFELVQSSEDYPVARRPERRKEKPVEAEEPKGKPKPPSDNPDLEPVRAALAGTLAMVVEVDRRDEILSCVDAFHAVGIRPILFGGNDAHEVGKEIAGKIRGVILNHAVTYSDARMGTRKRNRYAELQAMGIPVAFHSAAEEGAADLPIFATYAISEGMSPVGALRALTSDAATMFGIEGRVGTLTLGHDADVVLLDHSPMDGDFGVQRVWVDGVEVRVHR